MSETLYARVATALDASALFTRILKQDAPSDRDIKAGAHSVWHRFAGYVDVRGRLVPSVDIALYCDVRLLSQDSEDVEAVAERLLALLSAVPDCYPAQTEVAVDYSQKHPRVSIVANGV